MKKQFLLSALLLASLSATFVSCKKDKDPEKSRKELITGAWTVSGVGEDANSNGTLEESEYDPLFKQLSSANVPVKQTFNADGNGNLSFVVPLLGGDTLNFTWSLVDNDQTLRVMQEGDSTATDATITTLEQNKFEYSEKTGNPRTIFLLTR